MISRCFLLVFFLSLLSLVQYSRAFPQRVSKPVGEVALNKVESWASGVAVPSGKQEVTFVERRETGVQGLGGSVMRSDGTTDPQVWTALAKLERDSMYYNDDILLVDCCILH